MCKFKTALFGQTFGKASQICTVCSCTAVHLSGKEGESSCFRSFLHMYLDMKRYFMYHFHLIPLVVTLHEAYPSLAVELECFVPTPPLHRSLEMPAALRCFEFLQHIRSAFITTRAHL